MHQVYFVRHGETVWNVENKICGATESPLTARGREQARAIGRELRARMDAGELKLDRMLCSPLSRARDTAEEIANILELPLAVDVRLREQNFGKWEGTARDGEGFQRAKENFIDSFSGGESMMRVAQRIISWMSSGKRRTQAIFWSRTTASPALWSPTFATWKTRNSHPSEFGMQRSAPTAFPKRDESPNRGKMPDCA